MKNILSKQKGMNCDSHIHNSNDKGGSISEGILTLAPLPIKGVKLLPWAENLNTLFTVSSRKFKFSAQGSDSAPFVGNGTKIKD